MQGQHQGKVWRPEALCEKQFPNLTKLASDLTQSLEKFFPLIGSEKPLESALDALSRDHRQKVLIWGRKGVGKTTLVEEIVRQIRDCCAPPAIQFHRVIKIAFCDIKSASHQVRDDLLLELQKMNTPFILVLSGLTSSYCHYPATLFGEQEKLIMLSENAVFDEQGLRGSLTSIGLSFPASVEDLLKWRTKMETRHSCIISSCAFDQIRLFKAHGQTSACNDISAFLLLEGACGLAQIDRFPGVIHASES